MEKITLPFINNKTGENKAGDWKVKNEKLKVKNGVLRIRQISPTLLFEMTGNGEIAAVIPFPRDD